MNKKIQRDPIFNDTWHLYVKNYTLPHDRAKHGAKLKDG